MMRKNNPDLPIIEKIPDRLYKKMALQYTRAEIPTLNALLQAGASVNLALEHVNPNLKTPARAFLDGVVLHVPALQPYLNGLKEKLIEAEEKSPPLKAEPVLRDEGEAGASAQPPKKRKPAFNEDLGNEVLSTLDTQNKFQVLIYALSFNGFHLIRDLYGIFDNRDIKLKNATRYRRLQNFFQGGPDQIINQHGLFLPLARKIAKKARIKEGVAYINALKAPTQLTTPAHEPVNRPDDIMVIDKGTPGLIP
jgi:hypothetical protein